MAMQAGVVLYQILLNAFGHSETSRLSRSSAALCTKVNKNDVLWGSCALEDVRSRSLILRQQRSVP